MESTYRTFRDIFTSVSRFSKDSSQTFQTMIKEQIDRVYQDACNRHEWAALRRCETTGLSFSTTSKFLYCPNYVGTVLGIIDLTAGFYVEPSRLEYMAYQGPTIFNTAGKVMTWADAGDSPRLADFSTSAETLVVTSSSGSDTTQLVRINGIDSNSVAITELISVNGTSSVTSVNTYADYHSASCDETKVGILTITGNTSATVYGRMGPGEKTIRYKRLRLFMPPSTANSLAMIYKKSPKRLIEDQDIPEIPVSTYLVEKAMGIALEYDSNWSAAAQHMQLAEQALIAAIEQDTAGSDDAIQSRPALRPRYNSGPYIIGRPGG